MSTMTSVGDTLDRYSETPSRTVLRRFLAAAGTYWGAMARGLAAARAYHELIRLGATHEEAVEKVFDQHLQAR
jgi:hypothetical protein